MFKFVDSKRVDCIYDTMLQTIDDHNIFSIEPQGDNFILREECDGYFDLYLTPYEVRQLALELLEIVDEPK
jgi:hypothetical protein